jgi:excisionase family DNA binding protein
MKILDFFLTESQAAEVLGVNRLTVLRWIKEGRFDIQRVGREVLIPKWEIDLLKTKGKYKRKAL